MTGSKFINNRILIALSLIAVLIFGSAEFLYAEDGVSMPDLSRDSSTLTVKVQYTDKDVTTPIKGMKLEAYQVAELSVNSGRVNYTSTEAFKSVDVDYNNLTVSSSIDAAKKLSKVAEGGKVKGITATSDGDGMACFGSVDHGMWLILQTDAIGKDREYTRIQPYIVMAPQPLTELGENAWEYDVVSIPKMEIKQDDETMVTEGSSATCTTAPTTATSTEGPPTTPSTVTPTTKPGHGNGTRTGDEFAMYLRILMILVAVSALTIVIILKRFRRKNN